MIAEEDDGTVNNREDSDEEEKNMSIGLRTE